MEDVPVAEVTGVRADSSGLALTLTQDLIDSRDSLYDGLIATPPPGRGADETIWRVWGVTSATMRTQPLFDVNVAGVPRDEIHGSGFRLPSITLEPASAPEPGTPVAVTPSTGREDHAADREPSNTRMLRTVLWLGVSGVALDQREAVARLRLVGMLPSDQRDTALTLLTGAWARAMTLLDSRRTKRLMLAVERVGAFADVAAGLLGARLTVRSVAAEVGAQRTVDGLVFLLSVVARLAAREGWAGNRSVAGCVADWLTDQDASWVWDAGMLPLSEYDDVTIRSLLVDEGNGPVNALYWWLHQAAETLAVYRMDVGPGRAKTIAALTEHGDVFGSGAVSWQDLALTLMSGDDTRFDFEFPVLCRADGDGCPSCRAAAVALTGGWARADVAHAAVNLVGVLADATTARSGISLVDDGWSSHRRRFLAVFAARCRATEQGSAPPVG